MTLAGKRLADDLSEGSNGATGPGDPRPNYLVSHDNAPCRPRTSSTRPGPPRRPLGRQIAAGRPRVSIGCLDCRFRLSPPPWRVRPRRPGAYRGSGSLRALGARRDPTWGWREKTLGESAEGSAPCSAATLWAGNEASEEAVVARSAICCYLLPHQVHPKRACGVLVLLPPVKWLLLPGQGRP